MFNLQLLLLIQHTGYAYEIMESELPKKHTVDSLIKIQKLEASSATTNLYPDDKTQEPVLSSKEHVPQRVLTKSEKKKENSIMRLFWRYGSQPCENGIWSHI